jgi:pimeloyl-ACP methyl ester carboxylesterase
MPAPPTMSDRRRASLLGTLVAMGCLLLVLLVPVGADAHDAEHHGRAAKPTIVLVHGAWADSSSWSRVVGRLQRAGYTVSVPPNPLRSLPGDAAYIASYLKTIRGPVVLVGHSYGGAVITNAALGNANVKALVFINAFIPEQGESVAQLAATQRPVTLSALGTPSGAPAWDAAAHAAHRPSPTLQAPKETS